MSDAAPTDNAAKLAELHPAFRPLVVILLDELRQLTWQPKIVYAYRSPQEQMILFQSGRSRVKFSFHNAAYPDGRPAALAVDVIDRRYAWTGEPAPRFFENLGTIARALGLVWGGDWHSFPDKAHVQFCANEELYRVARGWLPPDQPPTVVVQP